MTAFDVLIVLVALLLGGIGAFVVFLGWIAAESPDVNLDPEIDSGAVCPRCLGWKHPETLDAEDLSFNPKVCKCKS